MTLIDVMCIRCVVALLIVHRNDNGADDDELLMQDTISLKSIFNTCEVVSLAEYEKKLAKMNKTKPAPADMLYFTRFFMQSKEMEFKTTLVPLLCLCNQPLNPDELMILCASCEERYHPKCLGITNVEAKRFKTEQWTCPICVIESQKRKEDEGMCSYEAQV